MFKITAVIEATCSGLTKISKYVWRNECYIWLDKTWWSDIEAAGGR